MTVELDTQGSPRGAPYGGDGGRGPDPLIGKELLHYRVVEVIGQGGMSVVYRGHDQHLHRDVAIKVLHPFLAEKAECRARLAREARAVARLEHPHVLKVFDFSGDPPTLDETPDGKKVRGFAEGFIVAELVRGATLKRFAEQHDLWRVPEVGAMVVWQIAKALEHAHANGVVHRDLKPENVMVRDDGWLKLMDFGIAHIADQKGLTVTGTLLGSPAHMAPESIDGFPADERSDLFSLGTVLYWLATGHLPFEALTPHALLKQIVEGRSIPVQQRSPRVSDDLARVIARAMATKPADRYQTAADFAAALEELLARAGLPAAPDRLRALLAAPDAALDPANPAGARASVRAAYLQRAEQLLADGSPARALSCLSRVLADDKDDADARKLLERAQGDIETRPPEDAPAVDALVTSPTLAAEARAPRVVEREPRALGRVAMQLGVVAAAAALITSAVVIATRLDASQPEPDAPESGTSAMLQPDVDRLEPERPPVDAPADAPRRDDEKRDDEKRAAEDRDERRAEAKVKRDEAKRDEAKRDEGKPDAVAAVTERKVTVWAKPWADVYVDGAPVVKFTKKADITLPLGPHVITFKATGAKDEEVRVDVTEAGPLADIKVVLEPQPAYLVVDCSQPDAFVQVSGQGGKPASETKTAAIVVPLEQSREKVEVTVFKKGFLPFVKKLDFAAGRTRTETVVLERNPNEGAP